MEPQGGGRSSAEDQLWRCAQGKCEYWACRPTMSGTLRCLRDLPACLPAQSACFVADECCAGVCARDGATGSLLCQDACLPAAPASCAAGADCCEGRCSNGHCRVVQD